MVNPAETFGNPEMVYPWMAGGNLRRYVTSKGKDLNEAMRMKLVSDIRIPRSVLLIQDDQLLGIASGLHYLHFEGIVHEDLRGVRS